MDTFEIINTLRDDGAYYGPLGKKFLSNSDINTLRKNPKEFGMPKEKTVEMLLGNYIHELTFEGKSSIGYVSASSRNTNIYKDAVKEKGGIMLLEKEVVEAQNLTAHLKSLPGAAMLFDENNIYEEPMIKDLFGEGVIWKGKADIINHDTQIIIDLKTTSNIDNFSYAARTYNYDSQAYIYKELFGYEMKFFVIEKGSLRSKIVDVSDETLQRGRDKAMEAEINWRDMFKNKKTNPQHFIEYGII